MTTPGPRDQRFGAEPLTAAITHRSAWIGESLRLIERLIELDDQRGIDRGANQSGESNDE